MALLTIEDVARILNISTSSIRREVQKGNLPAIRINKSIRFDENEVQEFIKTLPIYTKA